MQPSRAPNQTILEINAAGTPILLVEQNAVRALEVAHRGYVLETGNIVQTGTGAELLRSPDVQREARRQALEDIMWALLTSKEFLFNY